MLDFEICNEKDFSLIGGMDPFKSIAVPRPIAWISTVSKDGVDNLAPYSQFTNVGFNHPHVLFAAQLNAEGKKNLAVKTGTTLSVFNGSKKQEAAQNYLEIFFRDEIYQKFADFAKTPSVKETVTQNDALINSIFDENKYTFVQAYDSRMPRYFPLVSAAEVTSLMKGDITPKTVADTLQTKVEENKDDWQKYTGLAHTK